MKSRPEALLERHVLAALTERFGSSLAIFKNEVGEGFYAASGPQILRAVAGCGPDVVRTVKEILGKTRVHYGLHVGSADLVGFATGGRAVSLELKSTDGRLRPEQEVWLSRMRELGVIAGVARSPEEAIALISEGLR